MSPPLAVPAAVLTLLALALAGCTAPAEPGDAAAPQPVAATGGPSPLGAPVAGGERLLALGGAPVLESFTETGSFQATDHATPTGHLMQMAGMEWPHMVRIDVTERVPRGVPTRVVADLQSDLAHGDLDLWIEIGENEFWTGDWGTPFGGDSRFEAVIVRSTADPINIVVQYDEIEPAASVDWTLAVEIGADPAALPVGVAYGIRLGPGSALSFAYAFRDVPGPDRPASAVRLWGPDDAFLGRTPFEGDTAMLVLPADAPTGEYVLQFSQGRGDVRVTALAGVAEGLRLLSAEWVLGEPQVVMPGQTEVTWTFDLARVPLLVGLFADSSPALGTAYLARLESPAGPLFDFSGSEGAPYLFPGVGGDSGYGAENLVTGTYTATGGQGQTVDTEPAAFRDFVVHYAR